MEESVKTLINAGQTTVYNYLLAHYRDIGMDNDDLVIYMQIHHLQSQGDQATLAALAKTMRVTEQAVSKRIQRFVQQDLVTVLNLGNRQEYFDFSPLFDQLLNGKQVNQDNQVVSTGQQSRRQVVRTLQGEFGRQLSPMELQTVNQWFEIEHFDPNMMILAIQEAIANNARSLRYIESILINWKKANLTSPQAVQIAKERRRGVVYDAGQSSKAKGNQSEKRQPTVPIFKFDDL